MLGLRLSSASKAACAALTAAMLFASVSVAASVRHHAPVNAAHEEPQPAPSAQAGKAFPGGVDQSNVCIGGYRYMQHFYNSNSTPEEESVPLPCH